MGGKLLLQNCGNGARLSIPYSFPINLDDWQNFNCGAHKKDFVGLQEL